MTIYIILAIALLVLFFVLYIVAHLCKKLQIENNQLQEENAKQKATIVDMYKHAEELAQIQKDKSEVNQKIKEAKTDEEISEIINGIIAANNAKLRK